MKLNFCISLIVFILIGSASGLCFARGNTKVQSTAQKLDEYLKRIEAFGFSGQIFVLDKDRVLLNKGYGAAKRNPFQPINTATVFDLASLTKQFTAAGILHLEMEGKLKTADPIAKYLDSVPTDKAEITIMQLITHTSGLRRDAVMNESTEILTRDETVDAVLRSRMPSKPGDRYGYSNAGYNLLAAIIERASGKKYFDYLNEVLFKPAGMRSTMSETDYKQKNGKAALHHNEWKELSEYNARPESWHFFGPSGISSTVGDLYKWVQALRGAKVLSKTALEKFVARQTPLEDGVFYGYGWFVEKAKNGTDLISSGGDITGSHSEFRWEVQNQRLIVVLTNQDVFGLPGGAVQKRIVADNITDILDGDSIKEPPKVKVMPKNVLRRYEGTYALATGEKFKVWLDGTVLKIGAEGQKAIDLLLAADANVTNKFDDMNKRTDLIFKAISKNETDSLKPLLTEEEFGTYIRALTDIFKEIGTDSGAFSRAFVRGTIPFPYNKTLSRTYVRMEFERKGIDLFIGCNNGKINDITTGEEKPFPLILPIASRSKKEFSSFNLFNSTATAISFELEGTAKASALSLYVNGERVTAIKN